MASVPTYSIQDSQGSGVLDGSGPDSGSGEAYRFRLPLQLPLRGKCPSGSTPAVALGRMVLLRRIRLQILVVRKSFQGTGFDSETE